MLGRLVRFVGKVYWLLHPQQDDEFENLLQLFIY